MRHFIILIFLWIISLSQTAAALNTFKAKIIDGDSGEPLIGASATVEGTQLGNVADKDGFVEITGIPDGHKPSGSAILDMRQRKRVMCFLCLMANPM